MQKKAFLYLLSLLTAFLLIASAEADVIRDTGMCVFPYPDKKSDASGKNKPVPFDQEGAEPQDSLEIWFGKVSVCDAIIIRCHGETMLVDGGNRSNGAAARQFLNRLGVKHVNYIYNTHHHDDHIEMEISLVSRGELTADVFLTPYERGYNVNLQREMEAAVDAAGIEYRVMHDGDEMMLGGDDGARIQFYRWNGSTNPNYASMFCKITYRSRTVLMLADVTGLAQKALEQEREDIDWKADLLKAGHHGYSEQNNKLMEKIRPSFCIITNSQAAHAMNQMKRLGIPCELTGRGTIYFWTDGGENWYYNRNSGS